MINKKTEFTEEQKEAINELKEKNEEKIKKLNKFLEEYKKQLKSLDSESEQFWQIMKTLEKSNSNYPFGHFTNYYYKDFKEPRSESFLSEFGDKNPNFHPLTDEKIKSIENELPNYQKWHQLISGIIERLKDIVSDILSENMFIKRIVGLPEKYSELQEAHKNWWYPQEVSTSEYQIKGSFPVYDPHLKVTLPYHREKMIKYSCLFNTSSIVEVKIKEIISILKSINSYIPFAELIPAEKMPNTFIDIKTNASSVGDSNKFEGDTIIGEDGKIEK